MKRKKFLNKTVLVFVGTLLVFSVPLMTEAQIAEIQAKRDAEKDAKVLNELKWFGAGCLGGVSPFIVMDAAVLAELTDAYDLSGLLNKHETCFLILFGASFIAPTGYAILHSPSPPIDRFLGKSSDYIDAYTTAYKRRVKGARILSSIIGCGSGISIGWLSLLPLVDSLGGTPDGE